MSYFSSARWGALSAARKNAFGMPVGSRCFEWRSSTLGQFLAQCPVWWHFSHGRSGGGAALSCTVCWRSRPKRTSPRASRSARILAASSSPAAATLSFIACCARAAA
eukprot:Amastigsp_a842014_136.p4 type:complete len:107 gc:universal Amastigsp_a842014_136:708-388(-)